MRPKTAQSDMLRRNIYECIGHRDTPQFPKCRSQEKWLQPFALPAIKKRDLADAFLFITAAPANNAAATASPGFMNTRRTLFCSFRITELYQRMMERRYLRILVSASSRFESM
jgi:hypothetical protein